jgi:hypothetical protein
VLLKNVILLQSECRPLYVKKAPVIYFGDVILCYQLINQKMASCPVSVLCIYGIYRECNSASFFVFPCLVFVQYIEVKKNILMI